MKRFSRFAPARAVALAAAFFLSATTARAQVLQQVPADALVVLKVKSLQSVSEKSAVLAKQWGLVEMNPDLADPIGTVAKKAGWNAGFDKSGEAAIVLLNGDLNADKPPVIGLFPVSDYDAFIKNFDGAQKDGDLDVVHMSWEGNKDDSNTYVAHWGKYAVVADQKELLAKKPDGFKVSSPATAKELDTKDAVVVANFKVLGPMLKGQLTPKKDEILGQVKQATTGDERLAKYSPLIQAAVSQALASAEEFLSDAQYASFAINLNDKGIGTSLMAEFGADTYLGKAFAGVKNTAGPMLGGLPQAKYLFFGGSVTSGDSLKQVITDFLKPIDAELAKTGDDLKPVVAMVNALKDAIAAQKGQVFGMVEPTGALGTSALIQTVSVIHGDAKVIIDAQKRILESEQSLMEMIPNPPGGKRPAMKFGYTPDAKEVDGVKFAQFTSGLDPNDNSPEAMQAKQMLAIMYGPGGAGGYIGALDDQHVLVLTGLDDATISAAIKAAKENKDVISSTEGVALVAKNLPQQRVSEFYVAFDEIINTASNYAKMMGIPIPVNMKPNLPPFGAAMATEGPAVRIDSFVPSDLVEAVITTSLQLKMMGGGKGKPGGL